MSILKSVQTTSFNPRIYNDKNTVYTLYDIHGVSVCHHTDICMERDTVGIEPDICTSLGCNNYGCDYCVKCSHAYFYGHAKLNGWIYQWCHNPWFGPMFKHPRKKLAEHDHYPWCPRGDHPVWDKFQEWLDKL